MIAEKKTWWFTGIYRYIHSFQATFLGCLGLNQLFRSISTGWWALLRLGQAGWHPQKAGAGIRWELWDGYWRAIRCLRCMIFIDWHHWGVGDSFQKMDLFYRLYQTLYRCGDWCFDGFWKYISMVRESCCDIFCFAGWCGNKRSWGVCNVDPSSVWSAMALHQMKHRSPSMCGMSCYMPLPLLESRSHIPSNANVSSFIQGRAEDGDGLLTHLTRGFEGFFHLYLDWDLSSETFHRVETTNRIEAWLLFEFVQAASCRSLVCTSGSWQL